jgi:serine-type D-Ala-D-Ala carboxypeptidase (penicillin-binding protein 5/6)
MIKRLVMWALCLFGLIAPALAQTVSPPVPAPPKVGARAYVLIDHNSRQILTESHIDVAMEPASLTKIMTVYVVAKELQQGHIKLDDQVVVSENAWRASGSRMFIQVGTQVSVKDLLMGIIVQSGNDASVAIAEHVSGSEQVFAELMNQHAAKLGLKGTHFMNSTGLPDPDHYTTARDLATLATALIRDMPEIYEWFKIPKFKYNNITQPNRNLLLRRDPSVDGIKTGHTETAGYCLVASAKRENMRLTAVVLGTAGENARTTAAQALLNYGFRFYETHRLYTANQSVTKARIWKGNQDTVDLGFMEDLYVTVPRNQYQAIHTTIELGPKLIAPVTRGKPGGTLKVALGDKPLVQRPLVLLHSVEQGGIIGRLIDHIRLYFE